MSRSPFNELDGPDQDHAQRREPFIGNQVRFALKTLKRARTGDAGLRGGRREPLFGNRLRWAADVLRDSAAKRRARKATASAPAPAHQR